jgi:hypothetical protein
VIHDDEALSSRTIGMVARSEAFFGKRLGGSEFCELTDVRAAEQSEPEPDGQRYLSIAELGIRKPARVERKHDYLVLMLLKPRSAGPAAGHGIVRVVMPDTLTGSRREASGTALFNDLAVASPRGGFEAVSVLIYSLERDPGTVRVTTSLQRIADVMRETPDGLGALCLSQAVLDRVEVLEASRAGAIVLAGRASEFADARPAAGEPLYRALVQDVLAPTSTCWWVRGSSLQRGETAPAAEAISGVSYLLLKYGVRSTRESIRRFIDELRHKHTPGQEGVQTSKQTRSFLSYVQEQADKRRQTVIDRLYSSHNMLPVVTPIAIEAASNLEKVVALGTEPETELQRLLAAMREEFKLTRGVQVPGLRVRLNERHLPDDTYILMLDEVPLVSGSVAPDRLLCSAPPDRLHELGFDGDEAKHPASQRPCAWISTLIADDARAAGFTTWNPSEYIVLHLESVLRANLRNFLGTDELVSALRDAQGSELISALDAAPGGLGRFRNAVLALLDEDLPVSPAPALARRYLELVGNPLPDIAEELRLLEPVNGQVLRQLVDARLFMLASDFFGAIRRHVVRRADGAALALPPELTQEALTAVRTAMQEDTTETKTPVILVDDWRVRPFVKKLIELEFPGIKVLARREVGELHPTLLADARTISLE